MALKIAAFTPLIGTWSTVSTHPMLQGELRGHVTFDWIEEGAFLRMRSTVESRDIPDAVAIIGVDDASDVGSMLYFDERGVARIFQTTFADGDWTFWRDAPGFRQRCTATVAPSGDSLRLRTELSRDDVTFAPDLEATYTRESR